MAETVVGTTAEPQVVSDERVRRTQVPHPTTDGETLRLYYVEGSGCPPMPSVTTVKELRVDPEKEDALDGWRQRYDGQSQWARPWYKDQKAYKAHRGTLIHFAILDALGDAVGETYHHQVGDTGWGLEEYYSEYCLKKWSRNAPSANTDEVPYTPRKNRYDGEHAWDRAVREMKWAANAFNERFIQSGHIDTDSVRQVESFLYDTEFGYGGQFDLLYEDDGDTVLADLKTSSAVRFDHKLQAGAYKHAIESTSDVTVDRCEILRVYPDDEEVSISASHDIDHPDATRDTPWDRSLRGLEYQFLGLVDQARVEYQETIDAAAQRLGTDSTTEQ
jgi:hypothetical protein